MATTTWGAIRANMTAVVKALSPTTLEHVKFDRAPRRYNLQKWAQQTGSGSLRKFEIRRKGKTAQPGVHPPSQVQRNETALITVAYPALPALYGAEDLDSLEDVVRADANLIYKAIVSPVNFLSGQAVAAVDIEEPQVITNRDGQEVLWLQRLTVALIYDEAT